MKLQERMLRAIKQRAGSVILRRELAGLGSASQVTEALKALQARGVIVRIGTGVYAKTRRSSVTGKTIPAGTLEKLGLEALRKPRAAGSARSHFLDVQCSTARIKVTRGTRHFARDALSSPLASTP